jgi:hypothetical protein
LNVSSVVTIVFEWMSFPSVSLVLLLVSLVHEIINKRNTWGWFYYFNSFRHYCDTASHILGSKWRFTYSIGNLSSSANVVDMRIVSRCGLQKVGSNHRNFRVNALFGGKKDNEQSGDKVSQVCFLLPSLLHMNIHTGLQICFLSIFSICWFFFFHHSHKR